MSNRITKDDRDYMVEKAQAIAGVTAEKAALVERQGALALEIMQAIAGGAEAYATLDSLQAELDAVMAKVPEPYRDHTACIASKDRRSRVYLAGRAVDLTMPSGRWAWATRCTSDATLPADHPLVEEYFQLKGQLHRLDDKAEEIRLAVFAALGSATYSRKRLLEAWPEAAELLPPATAAAGTALVVPVGTLNTLIGLPSASDVAEGGAA